MAHNINVENGKASFFSLRESAWHRLGNVVNQPVSGAEAINLAGQNWLVKSHGLYREDMEVVEGYKVLSRSDNGKSLGIVGSGFTPVQNHELYAFLAGLDGFANVTLETAGVLGKGETVWVLARVDGLNFGIRGDEHKAYMAIINGHVGNSKLIVMPTSVRIVCQNTLRMALESSNRKNTLSSGFTIRHTSGILDAMKSIREAYTKTTAAWKNTEALLNTLADVPLTEGIITTMFRDPWKVERRKSATAINAEDVQGLIDSGAILEDAEADESTRAATIAKNREDRLRAILASETCQQPGTRDTLFSAFNAVTEYIEHEGPTRVVNGDKMSAEERSKAEDLNRFESANFGGNGDTIKARALKKALELAGAGA